MFFGFRSGKMEGNEMIRSQDVITGVQIGITSGCAIYRDGEILGRCIGRMEFGARALGNRSILADPRSTAVIKKINSKIKNRDFWMPFTPSMLSNFADKYLINPKNLKFPYMSVACETTFSGQTALAGALHPADATARPQIVDQSVNASYFNIIQCFASETGVGAC